MLRGLGRSLQLSSKKASFAYRAHYRLTLVPAGSLHGKPGSPCASFHSGPVFSPGSGPREDVVANVRLLKKLGGTPEEVKQYLNMYASVDNHRFGVIKVGGGVINEQLDDLVSSVSTLAKFGLIPIIVHGAGPQLNDTLKQMGIPSDYDEGLRITTPEILKVARTIFSDANFKLVSALENNGTRAVPIQTGVFEAKVRDMTRWGYVGEVTQVNTEPIWRAIDHGCVPVLTCMGQSEDGSFLNINADIAARDLAKVVQPRTVIYVSQKGGLVDDQGQIIQSIDINYDYDHLMSQPWFKQGDKLKLREIKDLMSVLPRRSTVSITHPKLMAKELLTHSLSGTLVSNTERILCHKKIDEQFDVGRFQAMLEHAFQGRIEPSFWDKIKSNLQAFYLSELYHGTAIITKVQDVPYLSKFAVSQETQMEGLGQRIFEMIRKDFPQLVWRSRESNPINKWYFQRSQGSFTKNGWTVFWYGLDSFNQSLIDEIVSMPRDIIRESDIPPRLMAAAPVHVNPPQKTSSTQEKHKKFKVGLIGARGYTGQELIKLIDRHPYLDLAVVSSRALKGKRLSEVYPGNSMNDLTFCDLAPEDLVLYQDSVHLWILAMPNGAASLYVENIHESQKVIDLSADFRFDSQWQYGLPERSSYRQRIRTSNRVANPGCYATGQQLALLPLLATSGRREAGCLVVGTPVVFGVSGYSGAGTTPSPKNDLTRLKDNLMAYSLQNHIHEREVSQQLSSLGLSNGVRFVPHVASWFRGIHLSIAVELDGSQCREDILYRYRVYYEDEPLVNVFDEDIPEVKDIAKKHTVDIGAFALNKEQNRLVLTATIDNLLKGAATQCIQNINLMLGLDEFLSILDAEKQTSN